MGLVRSLKERGESKVDMVANRIQDLDVVVEEQWMREVVDRKPDISEVMIVMIVKKGV